MNLLEGAKVVEILLELLEGLCTSLQASLHVDDSVEPNVDVAASVRTGGCVATDLETSHRQQLQLQDPCRQHTSRTSTCPSHDLNSKKILRGLILGSTSACS